MNKLYKCEEPMVLLPWGDGAAEPRGETRSGLAAPERTGASHGGGGRGAGVWPWRRVGRQSRVWAVAGDDHAGDPRVGRGAVAGGTHPARRGWAESVGDAGSDARWRAGIVGRAVGTRRSG